ncbi:MAG: anhydro-N-acetylmuramic acid kinase [Candidatus Thiodiazotropha sp.]
MPNESVFVGLISGTSLDGVDAAVVELSDNKPHLIASHAEPYPTQLRSSLRAICEPGDNEIDRMGELDKQVAVAFAAACRTVLANANIMPRQVTAIGSHGQTIRHRPDADNPFTLQIGDPNTIVELTGITTVADFRRRDMAVGGQGAPLVPAFHQALFQQPGEKRIILNLGGIANITCLPDNTHESVTGYDTGPANTLLDRWTEKHRAVSLDHQGVWARSGHIDDDLLDELLSDPYFQQSPPKSTGREYFTLDWLLERLAHHQLSSGDVQATLVELSAVSITQAIIEEGYAKSDILVCGGGVHNRYLLERLGNRLPDACIQPTSAYGVDPDWIEAITFAWLAKRTLNGLNGNLASVTGAERDVVLGGIYPA